MQSNLLGKPTRLDNFQKNEKYLKNEKYNEDYHLIQLNTNNQNNQILRPQTGPRAIKVKKMNHIKLSETYKKT